jgi:hypothetical protein
MAVSPPQPRWIIGDQVLRSQDSPIEASVN